MSFQTAVLANFDQLNLFSSTNLTYINQHIHFNNCPTFEDKLVWLIQEKHIALFAKNPIEAWGGYRRTGYPILAVPPNANPRFNPNLIIPRRYLYPISERTANENNLNEAILRQGGHLLNVDFWVGIGFFKSKNLCVFAQRLQSKGGQLSYFFKTNIKSFILFLVLIFT